MNNSTYNLRRSWINFVIIIVMATLLLAACGGKGGDCEHMFRLTEETPHKTLSMPTGLKYFYDPRKSIDHCKSCVLNAKKSGIVGCSVGKIWCHVTESTELPQAC